MFGSDPQPTLAWSVVMHAVFGPAKRNEQSISAFKHAKIYSMSCPLQERQSSFTADCIKWLRFHYSQQHALDVPVVLVGHSMGGLVARAAAVALAQEGAGKYGDHQHVPLFALSHKPFIHSTTGAYLSQTSSGCCAAPLHN